MKRIVQKTLISDKIDDRNLLNWVRDILIPLVRELRMIINSRFGEIKEISNDYEMGANDEVIVVDTDSGNINVYLPGSIGCTKTVIIKNIGSNDVVVYPNPNDTSSTIDGSASITITTIYYSYQFVTNGVSWYTVNLS